MRQWSGTETALKWLHDVSNPRKIAIRSESGFPEEPFVYLVGADQILQLFESGEGAVFKLIFSEIDLVEQRMKLLNAFVCILFASECVKMLADCVKFYA